MAKKRPSRRNQPFDDSPPDNARVYTGEIPWSVDDLGEALRHAVTLHHTPHDDWDRSERGINLLRDDGSVSRLVLNPDIMTNQVLNFVIARLRQQGSSDETVMSHSWRFMESTSFLAENVSRLRDEGLIQGDPTDPDATVVSGALVEVLATSKYEGARFQGPEREPVRSFHLDRVIAEAKRLDAEDEA